MLTGMKWILLRISLKMIFKKYWLLPSIILLLIFVGLPYIASAQNIYDAEHSLKYGRYLESDRKYQQAIQEYERALKYLTTNDNLKLKVINLGVKLMGKEYAISKLESFYPAKELMPLLYVKKYCTLLLMTGQNLKLDTIINTNKLLNDSIKYFYHFNEILLSHKWVELKQNTIPYIDIQKNYKDILTEVKNHKHKSPFVAASMSAIIPGMGKLYTGNSRDGLITMVIIALNTFEAYRGFTKYGTKSVLGWVSGGIALGYYGGGIYGSWKAASKYNNDFNNKIKNETEELLLTDF